MSYAEKWGHLGGNEGKVNAMKILPTLNVKRIARLN